MKDNKGLTTPTQFFFDCQKQHGRYPVTEETMMQFLSKTAQFNEANEKLKSGARGVILTFHDGCPRCISMNKKAEVTVSVIKPTN